MAERINAARGEISFEHQGRTYLCCLRTKDIAALEHALGIKWQQIENEFRQRNPGVEQMRQIIAHAIRPAVGGEMSIDDGLAIADAIGDDYGFQAMIEVAYNLVFKQNSNHKKLHVTGSLAEQAEQRRHEVAEKNGSVIVENETS